MGVGGKGSKEEKSLDLTFIVHFNIQSTSHKKPFFKIRNVGIICYDSERRVSPYSGNTQQSLCGWKKAGGQSEDLRLCAQL